MPTFTAETVDKAIELGLSSIGVDRVDADITIVEEGKKGFLGIGKKEAVVLIETKIVEKIVTTTPNIDIAEDPRETSNIADDIPKSVKKEEKVITITELDPKEVSLDDAIGELSLYLTDITNALGAPAMVRVQRENNQVVFHLDTDKKGLLIGKHGKVLNAIQYLSQVYIHRLVKNRLTIIVNVGDYRERRDAIIKRLANQAIRKVRDTSQPVFLEPMPAFERKQVHYILSNEKDIKTHSEGNEPHRYLIVELKK